jgi:hypothetical protein
MATAVLKKYPLKKLLGARFRVMILAAVPFLEKLSCILGAFALLPF